MFKKCLFLLFAILANFCIFAEPDQVVVHSSHGNGYELVDLDPPVVTYDDELNELTVYFGSSSTIDLECDDGIGPYYYIYGEYHYGNTSTTYNYLPAGYYTVTIHSIYGITYYGNFTVSY